MTRTTARLRMPRRRARFLLAVVVASVCAMPGIAQHGQFPQVVDEAATIENKLGQKARLDLGFVDDKARPFILAEHASGERPIILNLGYFRCPGMCGFVLNTFLDKLTDSGLVPGQDFDLWTISVNHEESARLARDKKRTYVDALIQQASIRDRAEPAAAPEWTAGWPFLTGDQDEILALTDSVGWRFRPDPVTKEIDHSPNLVVLAPDGTISRYLDARFLTASTLRTAIVEAGQGQVGSWVERLFVSCLTFDPRTHAYTITAMTVMQIGGVLTMLFLGGMIFFLWRRERSRHRLVEATT
jgi:protein SCO1/2